MAERKAFLLRLSPELYTEIEAWAGQDLRSVNGQIEYILKEAVCKQGRKPREAAPPHEDAKVEPDEASAAGTGRPQSS